MKKNQWCRWRQKHLIWFGGWELANCTGWRFRLEPTNLGKTIWMDPTPISILNRLTIYRWGFDLKCRRRHLPGWYVLTRIWRWKFYWSLDGTPSHTGAKIYWQGGLTDDDSLL